MRCDWQAASRRFLMEHAARGNREAARILRGLLVSERPHDKRSSGVAVRAAIGVCTAERPLMLARCLEAIGAQLVPQGTELQVVVVDNEIAPNSRHIVAQLSERCRFAVHYVHEPRRGIPQARNAVLAKCRELDVDWIAFTDDDCWVSPTWLESLME